jgi:hypothetical protein
MRFHYADDYVVALLLPASRRQQHGVGLAYSRRRAKEYLQPSAMTLLFLSLQFSEQLVGVWAVHLLASWRKSHPRRGSVSVFQHQFQHQHTDTRLLPVRRAAMFRLSGAGSEIGFAAGHFPQVLNDGPNIKRADIKGGSKIGMRT